MSFLDAEWRKLVIVNYEVNPELLEPFVPAGTLIDLWEGKCYLSLVGFMFLNTRILGIQIPGHGDFEEINLRFYVRRFDGVRWKRGVVFIRELVPKLALALVANSIFKENYQTVPMRHSWHKEPTFRIVEYGWKCGNQWNSMCVKADLDTSVVDANSVEEFITEHYWGYARLNERKSNEYEVTHVRWKKYGILSHEIDVDFASTYGDQFAFLTGSVPVSVILAEGSVIAVKMAKRIYI